MTCSRESLEAKVTINRGQEGAMKMSWARAFLAGMFIIWVGGCSTVTEEDLAQLQSANAMVKKEAIARISKGPSFPLSVIGGFLRKGNETQAVTIMTSLLQKGKESKDVQLNILAALGELGKRRQIPVSALIEKLKDKDPQIRTQAIEALAKTNDKAASAALVGLLDQQTDKYPIIWALGEIGDQSSIAALDRLLASGDKYVRYNARKALAKIGGDEAEIDSKHPGKSNKKGLLEMGRMAFRRYQRAMMIVFERIRGVKKSWAGT
jgi:HEAT repeat protein